MCLKFQLLAAANAVSRQPLITDVSTQIRSVRMVANKFCASPELGSWDGGCTQSTKSVLLTTKELLDEPHGFLA